MSVLATLLAGGLAGPRAAFYEDQALARGIQEPGTVTRAAAWEDLDGDGDLDVAFANLFYANRIYRNDGNGNFTDVSQAWGVDQALVENSYGVIVGDYDNDGDGDLFFTNGGFNSLEVDRLYRNDVNTLGRFFEVSSFAGVRGEPANSHGAAWVDFDGDGWLDLVVSRRSARTSFYRNRTDGTFVDIGGPIGAQLQGGANGVCAADFDNDGDADILFPIYDSSPVSRGLFLVENLGPEGAADATQKANLGPPPRAFTCAVDDFNQDGWLDIYVPTFNITSDPVKVASILFMNDGDGTFTPVTAGVPVVAANVMGLQSGDVDNNGFPDIYVGLGDPETSAPDMFLRNTTSFGGAVRFVDFTAAAFPALPDTRSHGTSFVDFDRDGRVDVFVGMGGNMPTTCDDPPCSLKGQEEPNRFFVRTDGPAGSWLRYRLEGRLSNRDAIGARVQLVTDAGNFHRHVSGGNGFNAMNPLETVAGLGAATAVQRVWLTWPSGIFQEVVAPALGQTHRWKETGIRAAAELAAGAVELEVVGPSAASYEIWGSESLEPLQEPAGVPLLASPRHLLATGALDLDLPRRGFGSANLARVSIPIPEELRDGRPLHFQARVQVDGGWYFTNRATVDP